MAVHESVMPAGERTRPPGAPRALAALALWILPVGAFGCGERLDCSQDCNCKKRGMCEAEKGRCIAGEDRHCRAADVCAVMGKCGAKDGKCVAVRPEDCTASEFCKKSGLCRLDGDACVRAVEP
jgi:hypothetical protein